MVNPSPYMIYMQTRGSILVASSPEILCRVGADGLVTNRYELWGFSLHSNPVLQASTWFKGCVAALGCA